MRLRTVYKVVLSGRRYGLPGGDQDVRFCDSTVSFLEYVVSSRVCGDSDVGVLDVGVRARCLDYVVVSVKFLDLVADGSVCVALGLCSRGGQIDV